MANPYHECQKVKTWEVYQRIIHDFLGSDLEVEGYIPESEVLRRYETREEDIDAFAHAEGHGHHAVGRGRAVEAADEI